MGWWFFVISKGGVYFAQICASPEGAAFPKVLGLLALYVSDGACFFWQIWRGGAALSRFAGLRRGKDELVGLGVFGRFDVMGL